MNKVTQKTLAFLCIVCFTFSVHMTPIFADEIAHTFLSQSASQSGSNGSVISIQSGGSPDASLLYINKGDNSSVIRNYFSGYYYDSVLGYFKMDSLLNKNENVRVVGSTSLCPSGYGYKLGGYAYSEGFGFVDFDFNSNIFVYYCLSDESLHGYAYAESIGFQNFEGITFPILIKTEEDPVVVPNQNGAFVNDDVKILGGSIGGNELKNNPSVDLNSENSNFKGTTIQNDVFNFEIDKESLFYIIK